MIFNPRLWMAMGGSAGGPPPPDIVAPTLAWTITANGLRANGVAAESLDPTVMLDSADFVFGADTGSVPAISSIGYATTTNANDTVQVDFATPFYAVQTVTVDIPAGAVEDLAGNEIEAVVEGPVDNGSTEVEDLVAPVLVWSTSTNGLNLNGVAAESLDPSITLDLADFTPHAPSGTAPTKSSISYQTTNVANDTVRIVLSNPVYEPEGAGITIDVAAGAVQDLAGNPNAAVTGGAVANNSTVWPVLWAFDAGNVTTSAGDVTSLLDLTGGGNHAPSDGVNPSLDAVTFADSCVYFNGAENLQVPAAITAALTTGLNQAFTLGFSFYQSSSGKSLITIGNATANYQLSLRTATTGRIQLYRRPSGGEVSILSNSASHPLGAWNTAIVTASPTTGTFYSDDDVTTDVGAGALAGTGTITAATTEGDIGAHFGNADYLGYMARGFIHNAELSGRPLAVMATWVHARTLAM